MPYESKDTSRPSRRRDPLRTAIGASRTRQPDRPPTDRSLRWSAKKGIHRALPDQAQRRRVQRTPAVPCPDGRGRRWSSPRPDQRPAGRGRHDPGHHRPPGRLRAACLGSPAKPPPSRGSRTELPPAQHGSPPTSRLAIPWKPRISPTRSAVCCPATKAAAAWPHGRRRPASGPAGRRRSQTGSTAATRSAHAAAQRRSPQPQLAPQQLRQEHPRRRPCDSLICGAWFCTVVPPGRDYRQRKFCGDACRGEAIRRLRRRTWVRRSLESLDEPAVAHPLRAGRPSHAIS